MVAGDCRDAAGLLNLCFSDPWSEEALEESCRQGDYLQLCAWLPAGETGEGETGWTGEDRFLVGYVGLKTVLDEGDITNVCIHPDWRGRGLASCLLEALLDRARQKGIDRIYLEVRTSNTPAIALYKKAGFGDVGMRKAYYEKPREDALVMCRAQSEL